MEKGHFSTYLLFPQTSASEKQQGSKGCLSRSVIDSRRIRQPPPRGIAAAGRRERTFAIPGTASPALTLTLTPTPPTSPCSVLSDHAGPSLLLQLMPYTSPHLSGTGAASYPPTQTCTRTPSAGGEDKAPIPPAAHSRIPPQRLRPWASEPRNGDRTRLCFAEPLRWWQLLIAARGHSYIAAASSRASRGPRLRRIGSSMSDVSAAPMFRGFNSPARKPSAALRWLGPSAHGA